MKRLFASLIVTAVLSASAVAAQDDGTTPKGRSALVPQTTCPVVGDKVNKDLYADYQGKRVYFCCAGCVDEFKKDPAKYVKKLEDAGVTLEKAPAATKRGAAEVKNDHPSTAGHGGATGAHHE